MEPRVVETGGILSTLTTTYEDTDADGVGDTVITTSDGIALSYIFENARRERVSVQTADAAGERDLRALMMYKYGIYGKGRTADLMIRRACGGYEYEDWGACASVEPVGRDPICITCVTVTETEAAGGGGDNVVPKATDWIFEFASETDNNLYMDPALTLSKSVSSWNPLDDARSLRSVLMGDMVLVGFAWTPNWAAAAQQFTDKYDFFVRRSFDGGYSWTNAAGDYEGPVNVSNLPNAKESIVEPRLVVQGGCRLDGSVFSCTDADGVVATVPSIPFVATYCTALNQERVGDDGAPIHAPGLDCFFALSPDNGDIYYNNRDVDGDESNVALIAANHDTVEAANECDEDGTLTGTEASYCDGEEGFDWLARGPQEQVEPDLRLVPSLVDEYDLTLHAVWEQNGELDGSGSQDGSDAWYRRIDYVLTE